MEDARDIADNDTASFQDEDNNGTGMSSCDWFEGDTHWLTDTLGQASDGDGDEGHHEGVNNGDYGVTGMSDCVQSIGSNLMKGNRCFRFKQC